jgi:hypothetical protein
MKRPRFDAQRATTIALASAITATLALGARFLIAPGPSSASTPTVQVSASATDQSTVTSPSTTSSDAGSTWGDDQVQVVPQQQQPSYQPRATTRGS